MNQSIVRVPPGQAAKVFGIIYLILGILFVPFFILPVLLGGSQQPFGFAFALLMPIFYAVMGFIGTAFFCWLYNVVASRVGGVQIELMSESVL